MSLNIWTQCAGKSNLKSIRLTAWRAVESQYQISTRKLVDTREEHERLEELIDTAKPPLPSGPLWKNLHFLLSTPFRYPPLHHGSRFRRPHDPGVWYGSVSIRTSLAETAYLRLRLLSDTSASLTMETQLTAFCIPLRSNRAVDFTKGRFKAYRDKISSKTTYEHSQRLGESLRENNVDFFLYFSARDEKQGINVGVLSPTAFAQKSPDFIKFENWFCYATKNQVEFKRFSFSSEEKYIFPKKQFEVDGKLPTP